MIMKYLKSLKSESKLVSDTGIKFEGGLAIR